MKRKVYEQFNLNIYIILPVLFSVLVYMFKNYAGIEFVNSELLNNYSVEISLAILSTLMTVLGLFAALPPNSYRKLMKQYHHDRIIIWTLFFGIMSAICSLLVSLSGGFLFIQQYLFIIMLTETCIASYWIAQTIRYSIETS